MYHWEGGRRGGGDVEGGSPEGGREGSTGGGDGAARRHTCRHSCGAVARDILLAFAAAEAYSEPADGSLFVKPRSPPISNAGILRN